MKTSEHIKGLWSLNLPWNKLSRKNILIVGATGLIGSGLVRALIANPNIDYNIYAMGRSEYKLKYIFNDLLGFSQFHIIEHDVTKPLNTVHDYQYIIDCASNANPAEFGNHPIETILGNVYGVNNLLSYGKDHNIERFLYVSSGEIYGESDNNTDFTEADSGYIDCLNPRSCYPASKRTAENLCIAYSQEHNIDVVIARPCHTYGPNFLPSDDRAYAQFFRKAVAREDIILNSPGLLNRSWCYIVDCVSAILYILLKGSIGNAYNIADTPHTIKEFAETTAHIAGVRLVMNLQTNLNTPIISRGILNSDKIRSLGWYSVGSLKNCIKECLEELKWEKTIHNGEDCL